MKQATVTFHWPTDHTVVEVHVNSHGEMEEEAIANAADVLKAAWGDQIVIRCDDLFHLLAPMP